jgi:2-phosphosulfolactate phosphatase
VRIVDSWSCYYEMTPDDHPVVGAVPGVRGLYLAAGFSGHGFMHAPATAQLVVEEMLDGRSRTLDISDLSLERFQGGRRPFTRLLEGARSATGHVVIVDVFRAFTTAAFCIAAGASEIVLVADHEEALSMKRADPSLFLTGEIGGRPIPGFDVGNSPSAIDGLDLRGRRVVQRTSSGTQGIVAAVGATQLLLGSLVIAGATSRYLAARAQDVSIVAIGSSAQEPAEEDEYGAAVLASRLLGTPAPPLMALRGTEWPDWFPRRDAELALEIDRFAFALPVERVGALLVARRADP